MVNYWYVILWSGFVDRSNHSWIRSFHWPVTNSVLVVYLTLTLSGRVKKGGWSNLWDLSLLLCMSCCYELLYVAEEVEVVVEARFRVRFHPPSLLKDSMNIDHIHHTMWPLICATMTKHFSHLWQFALEKLSLGHSWKTFQGHTLSHTVSTVFIIIFLWKTYRSLWFQQPFVCNKRCCLI